MSPLVLITKALEALKSEKAWYDFHYSFWLAIDSKAITIELLSRSRYALSFLSHEFEKELLKTCKHPNFSKSDLYEHCKDCKASRSREETEGHFVRHTEWTGWGFR